MQGVSLVVMRTKEHRVLGTLLRTDATWGTTGLGPRPSWFVTASLTTFFFEKGRVILVPPKFLLI